VERDKKGELKRGEASLIKLLPPLASRERGIKGVRVKQINGGFYASYC